MLRGVLGLPAPAKKIGWWSSTRILPLHVSKLHPWIHWSRSFRYCALPKVPLPHFGHVALDMLGSLFSCCNHVTRLQPLKERILWALRPHRWRCWRYFSVFSHALHKGLSCVKIFSSPLRLLEDSGFAALGAWPWNGLLQVNLGFVVSRAPPSSSHTRSRRNPKDEMHWQKPKPALAWWEFV